MKKKLLLSTLLLATILGCTKDDSSPKATSISLSTTSIELTTCDTTSLAATIKPLSYSGAITWSSNNSSVALVDSTGVVIATGAGNTVIKATAGSITAYCSVVVKAGLFIAGSQASSSGYNQGVVWRGSSALYSFGGESDSTNTYCNDLEIQNGIVYTVGSQTISQVSNATVWVNNLKLESLNRSSNGAYSSSIVIENGDIMVSGATLNTPTQATIWNSQSSSLLSQSQSSCNDMCYSGTTQYCVGYTTSSSNLAQATLWSNSDATILGGDSTSSYAMGIALLNGDVYVVGEDNNTPILWKNGVATPLTTSSNGGSGTSIYISGSDIYIAGYTTSSSGMRLPTYWVNLEQKQLADTTTSGIFNSIVENNGSIYLAGYTYDRQYQIATYWVNGTAYPLADSGSNSSANSIVVQ